MPRLILLNGPPGVGKSTLARRYADDHPGVLALDADVLRGLVGGAAERFEETGPIVRSLALAMTSTHLRGGRDVVLPQYLGRVSQVERFERAAAEGGGAFLHVVLMDDEDACVRRFTGRGAGQSFEPWHEHVKDVVEADGGERLLREMHGRVLDVLAQRPDAVVVPSVENDPDTTYAALLEALRDTARQGGDAMTDRWLPADFEHPLRVDLRTGHHLRPIRAADTELDMVAVMSSQERLFSIYGEAWGWPPATMTAEQDREDLQHHADEIERHESFNYALFDESETALLGCVYIDPPEKVGGADAEVSWWVVDSCVGTDVEAAFDELVPRWIAEDWPLERPRYVGRDLTWAEWLALDDLP